MFYRLLDELLNIVPTRKYTFGRPRKSFRDMIFSCMIKIYSNTSSRRTISELELAKKAGYIEETCHFNTLLNYFEDTGISIILLYLISVSSLPLKHVEESFAVDSTGFGISRYDRWLNIRTQKDSKKKRWKKCHAICGVKTNIITAVRITEGKANDSPQFDPLLKDTANYFTIREVSADKAYSSKENLELVNQLGAMPYIPFKKNVTGKSRGSFLWAKLFEEFTKNYLEFAEHYHKRSNIESCFAMILSRFTKHLRCKTDHSQHNEILCKILAHNLVVLVHEICELKIDVNFKKVAKNLPAQKVV